ncbi:MAG: hypothetical protein R3208_14555 [Ketobacteraceae bacterium]|nr:hypothetical protein [Ketobacteraceae bacterium]
MFTHARSGHLVVAASMDAAITLGMCEDSQRLYLWIVDATTQLGRIDVKTGDVQLIGKVGISMREIGFDNQGRLLGMNGSDVYKINPSNGALAMIGGTSDEPSRTHSFAVRQSQVARGSNVLSFGQNTTPSMIPAEKADSDRTDADIAFELARLFMKLRSDNKENMVQLAVIDGKSMEIGVFGYGTIYGRAKSHLNLFHLNDPMIYTTDSTTGNTTSIAEHPRNRLASSWNAAVCSESS